MNERFALLTQDELEKLDDFLLERIPEDDENWEEKDEGIIGISMLDGFFTAIVSSLRVIVPSQWMPAVWGDYELVWESQAEVEAIIGLMLRHMNGIIHFLMEEPENFEPIFMASHRDGETHQIVDDWCEGYLMGMQLDQDYWNSLPGEIAEQLVPIYAFGDEVYTDKLKQLSLESVRQFKDAIIPSALAVHAYALKRRQKDMQVRRDAPKTGRNDPCSCGSGLKFKKCCGKPPIPH